MTAYRYEVVDAWGVIAEQVERGQVLVVDEYRGPWGYFEYMNITEGRYTGGFKGRYLGQRESEAS